MVVSHPLSACTLLEWPELAKLARKQVSRFAKRTTLTLRIASNAKFNRECMGRQHVRACSAL